MSRYEGPIEVGQRWRFVEDGEVFTVRSIEGTRINFDRHGDWEEETTLRSGHYALEQSPCLDRATAKPAKSWNIDKRWSTCDPMANECTFKSKFCARRAGYAAGEHRACEPCAEREGIITPCGWSYGNDLETQARAKEAARRFDEPRAKPATTAPGRKLAKGWVKFDAPGGATAVFPVDFVYYGWSCTAGGCRELATYGAHLEEPWTHGRWSGCYPGSCEAHAAEMGVFEQFEGPSIFEALRSVQAEIDRLMADKSQRAENKAQTPCGRCAHRHIGPCTGRTPFCGDPCPCGHAEYREREGTEDDARRLRWHMRHLSANLYAHKRFGVSDEAAMKAMVSIDSSIVQSGTECATKTLLTNLERERVPGRRQYKVPRWYVGNGDE